MLGSEHAAGSTQHQRNRLILHPSTLILSRAGPVAGGERGGLVEKEKRGIVTGRHDRPPALLTWADAIVKWHEQLPDNCDAPNTPRTDVAPVLAVLARVQYGCLDGAPDRFRVPHPNIQRTLTVRYAVLEGP